MLAHFDARYGGVDRVIIRAGNLFAVAFTFLVPGIPLRGATAEPDKDAVVGLALGEILFLLRRPQRQTASPEQSRADSGARGAKQEITSCQCRHRRFRLLIPAVSQI